MGISCNSLRLPRFSPLSPLPSRGPARDHRASFNGPPNGDCCVMPSLPLTVPEIFAAATVATPRTRSILARCRQRRSLLLLRAVMRMITILRRSNRGRSSLLLHAAVHPDIGIPLTALARGRFSRTPRSSADRLHANHFCNVAITSDGWTVRQRRTEVPSRPLSAAFDDAAAVMP